MSDRKAPAGWYADPAGGGGSRYWNGTIWTERTEKSSSASRARSTAQDRLPAGYMILNGERVPLGTTAVAHLKPHSRRRTALIALIAAVLIVGLIAVLSA